MKCCSTTIATTAMLVIAGAGYSSNPVVTFDPPVVMPVGGVGGDVTTADLDADGDMDIIATTRIPDSYWVFLNDGTGAFAPYVTHPAGLSPRAVIAADLNNDGDLDIATANQNGSDVTVMTGDGAGGFSLPIHFATASSPMELVAADFNSDNLLDLAVTHKGTSTGPLVVLFNSGGAGENWLGFQAGGSYPIGSGSRSVDAVDIDLDGLLDLIVTNRESSTISILLGNRDGTFMPQISYAAGQGPRELTAGDFNGDGIVDLAVADFNFPVAMIFPNLGRDAGGWLGLGATTQYFSGGLSPHDISSCDFDHDGDLDLMIANVDTGDLSMLLNDGFGGFADKQVFEVNAPSAGALSLADLNGDGYFDSVNANDANMGSVSILINTTGDAPCIPDLNGDGVVDTADLGLLISAFGTANSHIDLNGDNIVDTADLGILIGCFGPCH